MEHSADGPIEAEWTIESGERFLRLVLFRAGDRYAHRIEARTLAGAPLQVIKSVEGCDVAPFSDGERSSPAEIDSRRSHELFDGICDAWPASPPFQQFHDQEIAGSRAWFLIGMAGKSHWSVSITALRDRSGWDFDVACRYRDAPVFLGSAYEIDSSVDHNPPIFGWGMTNVCNFPCAYWTPHTRLEGGWTGYRKRLASLAAPPASVRWGYVLSFNDSQATAEIAAGGDD